MSEGVQQSKMRVGAVDIVRGLVMVLMVLDHTRDFAHAAGLQYDATDLAHTTVPIYLTRWVTHLCAPTFVFLAGVSVYLQQQRGKPKGALSWLLITRGVWLIVLEFTVVNAGLSFHLDATFWGAAQVIWVIGVSMIVLAGLIWLPLTVTLVFGLALIAGHNAFDAYHVAPWGGPGTPVPSAGVWIWTVLHQPGMLPLTSAGTPMFFVLYPLVPWVGVMAVGYVFGRVYEWPAEQRVGRIAAMGAGLCVLFLIVRGINHYGDPVPWTTQASATFTVLSFFKVQKYPPSLSYLCVTLGISLLLLAWFERRQHRGASTSLERVLSTFGRVPMFFYLLQWFVDHGIPLLALMITGQDYARLLRNPLVAPAAPPGTGFSLPVVYGFWIAAIVLLYFPCRWYAALKARRCDWWLSYL